MWNAWNASSALPPRVCMRVRVEREPDDAFHAFHHRRKGLRMGVLKRAATNAQARRLVHHLKLAQDELTLAICHTHGLTIAEAGKLSAMCDRLRNLRYAIESERRFEWREGSGFWTWNERKGDWEQEPTGRVPVRAPDRRR